ncbi:hypothetical protein Ate01nite_30110 [Actinoplanes teichomyceticus]|nr:hypothetical protein Ate01nite_30110 [Actinoplanes teichomyceticus]
MRGTDTRAAEKHRAGRSWVAAAAAGAPGLGAGARSAGPGARAPAAPPADDCRTARPNPYRTAAAGVRHPVRRRPGAGPVEGRHGRKRRPRRRRTGRRGQGGRVRLEHSTTGRPDTTIRTPATSAHSHLVSYGVGRMLLTRQSGSSIAAQAYELGHRPGGAGRRVLDHRWVAGPAARRLR